MAHKMTIVLASLLVAGCAWNALYSKPSVIPVQVAFSGFKKPYPGKYLLFVSGAGFERKVQVGGLVCTAHDFSLNVVRSFEESVQKTLANVVEKLEVIETTMTQKQIKAARARAMIVVKARELAAHLMVSPGLFSKDSEARVKISAGVQVLKTQGGLFAERVSSVNTTSLTIGKCPDGDEPVAAASTKALKQLMTQIGKSVAQSLSSR